MVFIGQYQSARADNLSDILLFVVACVALGGFSLEGGKGNVVGLVLSILLLGTIQNAMGLANVDGSIQTLVIGMILAIAIVLPVINRQFETIRAISSDVAAKHRAMEARAMAPANAGTKPGEGQRRL